MPIKSNENIQNKAANFYGNITEIKRACDIVINDANVERVFDLYKQLVRSEKAFVLHETDTSIAAIKAALKAAYDLDDWATYEENYLSLRSTQIPNFLDIVDNKIGLLTAFISMDRASGNIIYNDVAGTTRTAVISKVTALLAEFS